MRIRPIVSAMAAILLCPTLSAIAAEATPESDPRIRTLLQEANRLAADNKAQEAIEKSDAVIKAYAEHYGSGGEKIYCARSAAENLAYAAKASLEHEKALVLSSSWADAYFIKGYALQELHRLPEAKESLQRALALSPFSSQYLSELGSILQLEKDWTAAKRTFKEAQDHSRISPSQMMAMELGRARRGYA